MDYEEYYEWNSDDSNEQDWIEVNEEKKNTRFLSSRVRYTKNEKPDLIKFKRPITADWCQYYDEDKTSVLVEVYETNTTPNFKIRDAITGVYYNYRVGSKDENRFYKVCWATGYKGRQSPMVLFFNGPNEFERHMLIKLKDKDKMEWRMKYIANYCNNKETSDNDFVHEDEEKRRVIVVK
jgi:hypothetical protein